LYDQLLPAVAAVFFAHISRTNPPAAVSLQTALHAKATQHLYRYKAIVEQTKRELREAITAPAARTRKMKLPLGPHIRLFY
jgi:hypothetical protein